MEVSYRTLQLAAFHIDGVSRPPPRGWVGHRFVLKRGVFGAGIEVTGQPVIFSGQAFSLKGEKGRYVLPSAFRKTVRDASGSNVLCLAKHDRWNCLTGFGLSRESELAAQLAREEDAAIKRGQDFDYDTRASQLYGFSRIPFDDSGRFVMPDHLALLGKLDDALYFQGGGTFFTLWSPVELYAMETGWEGAQAACRSFEQDVQAKSGGRKA